MGNVSILFFEKEKFYTIFEVSVLTGISVKDIEKAVRIGKICEITYRDKNDICEILIPLKSMESFICGLN